MGELGKIGGLDGGQHLLVGRPIEKVGAFAEPAQAARSAIIDEIERRGKVMREALRAIARGLPGKGMPLARFESQRVARAALVEAEEKW